MWLLRFETPKVTAYALEGRAGVGGLTTMMCGLTASKNIKIAVYSPSWGMPVLV